MLKTYLGAGLIALAGILFWVLVMPAYNYVSALGTALEERQAVLDDRSQVVANISSLTKGYAQRASDLERFSNIVPAKKNSAEIVSTIQALATQNGLILNSMALGSAESKEKNPYAVLSVDLGLSGSYPAFRSFLASLEQNIRVMDVISIDASRPGEDPTVGFRLKANAYYLKNDPE